MSRLTLLHINIIGVVVAVALGAALYFTLITSAQDRIKKNQTEYNNVKTEADKLPQAKASLKKAQEAKATAERDWGIFQSQYTPVIGYNSNWDRVETMIKLFWPNNGRSWPERFMRTVRQYMQQEAKTNGIVWENPGVLVLGPYGPDPNTIDLSIPPGDGLGENGTIHYTFPMAVRAKSLPSLLRHIKNWPSIRGAGVPVVENLNLSGNSPNLRATYDLTLTIILSDAEVKAIPPVEPRVGGTGGGRGAMPGFGPGGRMGAPMMGPPGMIGPGGMPGGMMAPEPAGPFPPGGGARMFAPRVGTGAPAGAAARPGR